MKEKEEIERKEKRYNKKGIYMNNNNIKMSLIIWAYA